MNNEQLQIAKTIQQQIGARRLFALGAKKLTVVPGGVGHLGGLTFKASLFGKQQCIVTVTLNTMDTYNIDILTPRATNSIACLKDVYCEQLGDMIEVEVEKHFAKR